MALSTTKHSDAVNTDDARAALLARRCVVRIHCVVVIELESSVMDEELMKWLMENEQTENFSVG